jgi:DNA topoisomerase IB
VKGGTVRFRLSLQNVPSSHEDINDRRLARIIKACPDLPARSSFNTSTTMATCRIELGRRERVPGENHRR